MQEAAEKAARAARLPEGADLAIVGLDPETGEVLAMVGGVRRENDEYNRATRALRNPGSAVKPFVYAAALEAGWTQVTLVPDRPMEFKDPSQPGGVWRPKNFSGTFLNREITVRYALDLSLNLPAVYTAQAVGLDRVAAKLAQAGFAVRYAVPAIAIGGPPLPLWTWPRPTLPSSTAATGWPPPGPAGGGPGGPGPVPGHPPQDAALQPGGGLPGLGPPQGVRLRPGGEGPRQGGQDPGAGGGGKTGTTNEARDLWFAGVTRGLSAVVWVGRDDNRPLRMGGGSPVAPWSTPHLAGLRGRGPKGAPWGRLPSPFGACARAGGPGDRPAEREGGGGLRARGQGALGEAPEESPALPLPLPLLTPPGGGL